MCVCALQMRAARLEQLDRELQEARGSQEVQLQVRLAADAIRLQREPSGLIARAREKNLGRRFEFGLNRRFFSVQDGQLSRFRWSSKLSPDQPMSS